MGPRLRNDEFPAITQRNKPKHHHTSQCPSEKMTSIHVLLSSSPEPSENGNSCGGTKRDNMMDLVKRFGNWHIRQDITYLDNGAFGACPTVVVEEQGRIRQKIEENPHDFFERGYVSAWDASRQNLADFLHAEPADLVFVPGATHGLNIVIQSLHFEPDDEILTTNHAYSSVILALNYVAQRDNARLVTVDIPLHLVSPNDVLQRILACVTSKTRFALIDHVPSRSGLVFPIKDIVRQLASHDVDTLVDGAHAAGMIDLDITDINAAYYVANCHKWMCSPRGVGFLHVRPDRAHKIKPLVIARSSYVVNKSKYSRLEQSFGWQGTSCPSAVLSLPVSIDFLNTVIPGGLNGLINRNHNLAVIARRVVCKALDIPLPCPDSMIGAMATIPLPDSPWPEQEGMLPIQETLWKEHKIVVPVYSWPAYPKRVIRLSAQAYNTLEEYFWFADCLRSVLYNEQNPLSKSLGKPLVSFQDAEYKSTERTPNCGHHKNRGQVASHAETPHQDIKDPEPWSLFWLAKTRIRRMMTGRFDSYPVAPYPTAGDTLIQFASANGSNPRHANLEITRMAFMLSSMNRRRIPQLMVAPISRILETEDVIEGWVHSVQTLKQQCRMVTNGIIGEMAAPRTPATFSKDVKDFVCRVVPYEAERKEENLSLTFWLRALADFNTRGRWSPDRIASFLEIHSFLKDPIGGLFKDSSSQMEVFAMLFTSLQPELDAMRFSSTTWEDIAVQLALESSFISQPLVRHPSYIYFSGDQQLVYSYVDIHKLARSEFASPPIVAGMIESIITSKIDECAIAPIAVAQGYTIYSKHDDRPIIVDGNNRITAISFLRFVATHGIPDTARTETLRAYCRDYGLGPIHFVDHLAVLQLLWEDRMDVIDILKTSKKLHRFGEVRQVPVLVTEESTFFTESLMDGNEYLLQPVHQSIFATDERLVALPS